MTGAHGFSWRDLPASGGRVENPRLRSPISLIVDDGNPGFNPAYFHLGFRHGPAQVPTSLVVAFADLVERFGVRGKFSVIPNPFGLGRIDHGVEGLADRDVAYFLAVVRERIAPVLDVTPEVLTHWNAVDLATGCLLPYWEHVWSRAQDRHTLIPYLVQALEIVQGVNLPSSGMTSPWDFGAGVEDEYAEALLAAQRSASGNTLTWYFLHADGASMHVPPRLSILRPGTGEAVVSIVCCDAQDFGRATWTGQEPRPDELLGPGGQGGRLAAVLAAGGPAVFHTHWQTLFSQGTHKGLAALDEVARRVSAGFGDRIAWTRCSDLAAYAAAAASVVVTPVASDGDEPGGLVVDAPFACGQFTLSLDAPRSVRGVRLDGKPLVRCGAQRDLDEGAYYPVDGRLYVCWRLQATQRLDVELR